MTNEKIKELIQEHQAEIKVALFSNCSNFELNNIIVKHKEEIKLLQAQCNHMNFNHEFEIENGYCAYCGTKM